MALSRRNGQKMNGSIWPGFVDAMTALLLVLMFVLSIFMIVQSVLRETIDSQGQELNALSQQVAGLADALGLERNRADRLAAEVGQLGVSLTAAQADGAAQAALAASLSGQLAARQADLQAATAQINSFEAQVASLLAERDAARGQAETLTAAVSDLEAAQTRLLSEQEALNLALARAREEVDAQAETARLAAARREALDAMVADLKSKVADGEASLAATLARLADAEGKAESVDAEMVALAARLQGVEEKLSDEEKARLADMAAAAALRAKLAASETELTAMTLALEEQRKRAEETLTLSAAAQAAASQSDQDMSGKDTLLATARAALAEEQTRSEDNARRVALLNEQIAALRGQLRDLQGLLDTATAKDQAANVRLDTLGVQLNTALAQVAAEQKKRAELEEAERKRLEAETQKLEKFRSEFFGQLREVLAGREGVRIVGDRFVFSSEVLFQPGSADLAPEGRRQIAGVVATLKEVSGQIPPGIDWIIRVDGHTDNVPLSGLGAFADNWELSQARALSVVRFMQDDLGFPPGRMAATGFGEWQPVALGNSENDRAQNRRIELKLTER